MGLDNESRLDALMAALSRERARQVRRLAVCRALWVAVALVLALVAVDGLLAPNAAWRLALGAGVIGAALGAARDAFRRHGSASSVNRRVARLVEENRPDLNNAVVNAIDFKDRLATPPDPDVSQSLMRRQIEEAARRLEGESGRESLRPPEWRRDRRALAGVAACFALLFLTAPGLMTAILPRLLLPFFDFPPYCLTRFEVSPGRARAEYGGSLDVAVKTLGRRPRSISLVVESRDSGEAVALPLYESEPDTYRQTLEPLTSDLVYYARVPGGRSRRFAVTVSKVPRIDTVRLALEYPAYTHLRPATRLLGNGEVKGYAGTRARLLLTSNRELAGGRMTLGGKPVKVIKSEQANTVEAAFTIGEPADFEITVADKDGRACREPVKGRVVVTPDERPRVAAVSPQQESLATPRARIPINIEAGDDLGVRSVVLFRNLNGSEDFSKTLYEAPGRSAFVNLIETLDLADLGVKPGDVIDYYLDATDSRPDSPQTASSPACRLTIISEEDYANLVQTMATSAELRERYEQFRREMKDLIDEQERLREATASLKADEGKDSGMGGEGKRRLQDLAERQAALARQTKEAAARLASEARNKPVYDVEADYKKLMADLARKLEKGAFHMDSAGAALDKAPGGGTGKPSASLARAVEQQEEALADLTDGEQAYQEQIAKANEQIEKLFALYSDVEVFKGLLSAQKEVVRKLHSYEGRPLTQDEKARVRDLGGEQDQIREQLGALKAALREHAKAVQAEYPKVAGDAEAIAAELEKAGVETLMKTASTALEKPDVPPGQAAALEAYDRMLAMAETCEGAAGEAQGQCEARLRIKMNMGLGKTFQQLARGAGAGFGVGMSGMGRAGVGSSASMPFGLYGSSELNGAKARESTGLGRGNAERTRADPSQTQFAMGSEERQENKGEVLQVELPAGEAIMEEYRPLILQYFRKAAEEP